MLHNTVDLHFAYGPVFGVNYTIDVGLFRANGVVLTPDAIANLIQEFLWLFFHPVSRLTGEGFGVYLPKCEFDYTG